jgi:AAA domain/IclR helix-turn-helix domain
MTQQSPKPNPQTITPIDIFTLRCRARADLYAASVFGLDEAVDVLQADAERIGVVDKHGQDEIQRIMNSAFAEVRKEDWEIAMKIESEIVPKLNGGHMGNNSDQPRGKPENKIITWRDWVYTAAELQHRVFPDISYCVPDLIPEGLTIIAGKPKIGKSWLALDICIAIAAGRYCLGGRKPVPGDVLYAAVEDNARRLQRRIDRLLSTFNDQWPEGLTLTNSWRRLDKGGVDDIRQWIETTGNPRLIILDTLAGVKPIRTREGYLEDYESLAALHRLASETGVSILVLHHTRKMEAEDPVDTVSGTLGLAGCADSVLILARSSQGTTLYVRGRDIEEAEHAVTFDKINCRWTILGSAADVHRSNERGRILAALEDAGQALSPQEIAASTGMPPNNIWQLLFKMVHAGEVLKSRRGIPASRSPRNSDPP